MTKSPVPPASVPEENTRFEEQLRCAPKGYHKPTGPTKLALGIAIEQNYDKNSVNISKTVFID